MSDTREDIEERARIRAEARAKSQEEQYVKDLLAKEAAEETYDAIATVRVTRYVPGQPTLAIVKIPSPEHYKRFKDQVARAAKKENAVSQVEAVDLLGKACWVYPPPADDGRMSEAQKAMAEKFPGIVTTLGNAAVALADGKAADEGKG